MNIIDYLTVVMILFGIYIFVMEEIKYIDIFLVPMIIISMLINRIIQRRI